jgi:putative component of membrane protein insertase Oxa1/YidC/SpoIIIJ protein YidD
VKSRKFIKSLFVLSFLGVHIFAQNTTSDFNLILSKEPEKQLEHKHKVSFGINRRQTFLAKYNPVNLTLSCLMYSYQKWLSPQISSNCYYSPSCSAYGKLLFQEYGMVKGLLSTADRLMRCDRISATTFNPISIDPVDNKIHEDINRYRFREKLIPVEPSDKKANQ